MIQIIRNVYISKSKPAGLCFLDDGEDAIKKACGFLWGKDCKFYNVYVNGHPVDVKTGEVGEIKKQMEKFAWSTELNEKCLHCEKWRQV